MKQSIFLIIIVFLGLLGCSKTDPITNERVVIEHDPAKKARETAARGGGLFGEFGKGNSQGTVTANFNNSNVLWLSLIHI